MHPSRHTFWSTGTFPADFRQAFERFFQNEESDNSSVVTSQWAPRVDIKEEDQRFVIFADVPGVDLANIEVSMEKGVLTIKGERAVEKQEQSGRFTRVERAHGRFHRRFALPDSADADNISAAGKHGVLEIVIPKKAEKAPRRITINTQ
ncbi:Hsp20/alpha crystallin family protein [Dyella nitratireducens]|uniref:Heat-shock protein n=1 Tax=Dyella nitratireducens TaxID=1849580 RepID=A0ABQ1FLD0_9GAMM|nr:Hsp20/alpha crystallin family protein [Dyella nitratireducens]GGA17881.1 heat-shock protein [Dyella nitratireducens]GLQ44731.1 heat-shock protein [Dyella nitratireducens]